MSPSLVTTQSPNLFPRPSNMTKCAKPAPGVRSVPSRHSPSGYLEVGVVYSPAEIQKRSSSSEDVGDARRTMPSGSQRGPSRGIFLMSLRRDRLERERVLRAAMMWLSSSGIRAGSGEGARGRDGEGRVMFMVRMWDVDGTGRRRVRARRGVRFMTSCEVE